MKLIEKQKELESVCKSIKFGDVIAIDLEFMRQRTFYGILCLIQVNVNGECFAIDPLSEDINLKPFLKILKSRWITKIFHSSRQDLEIIFQEFGFIPKSIFDTQLMANFLGYNFNASYAGLVKDLLGEELSKEQQMSNWKKRPLTDEQLQYAINDVKYLTNVYEILKEQLETEKKFKYFKKEMKDVLSKKEYYDPDKQDLFKKFSLDNKNPAYRNNLETLVNWRDKRAKERNIPRSFVLKDAIVNEISKQDPQNIKHLQDILENYNIRSTGFARAILKLLQNQKIRKFRKSKYIDNRLDEQQKTLLTLSQNLLKEIANENNIRAELIINQASLKDIILKKEKLKNILYGWRYDIFGKFLKKAIR